MYDGNPGEIDFGSSQREVRVTEGSSYRESTVFKSEMGHQFLRDNKSLSFFGISEIIPYLSEMKSSPCRAYVPLTYFIDLCQRRVKVTA